MVSDPPTPGCPPGYGDGSRVCGSARWAVDIALILVATAGFGGLDTVDTKVTEFKPGEEFSDGEFTVTVERARLVDELKR